MKITEYRYYWDDVKQEEVKKLEEREESFWATRLKEDGTFSFKTDRFFTYALAYENVKTTTSDTTTSGTNNIAPNTGDNSNIILYGAVALMAAVVLAISKKRSFVK